MQKFEDLIVWQKSRVLVMEIYKEFRDCRDYGFRDQIQRASISIMNNIAEGFERMGDREMARFFSMSISSCAEVRSMLYTGEDIQYCTSERAAFLRSLTLEIRKMLTAFITKLRKH